MSGVVGREATGRESKLPAGLAANPLLSRWVEIGDGVVSVFAGKVELGQGILTALAQIAAAELDVDIGRIRVVAANTASGPDQGITSGSMSIVHSAALRVACAEVRALFVHAAARTLSAAAADLDVADGLIRAPGGPATSYWELRHEVDLDQEATGAVTPKSRPGRGEGESIPRLDLPDKVTGRPRFIHDLRLPRQLYGRVVRPPSRAAVLTEVDLAPARRAPGVVAVERDGEFLGVVAEREDQAERAAELLRATARWQERPTLPNEHEIDRFLRSQSRETTAVHEIQADDGQPARRLQATYFRPFLAHASIAPSCAAARWDGEKVQVWTHSQGVFRLREAIANTLELDEARVIVQHVEGAGCYGHNGADDVAFDAVLLARSVPGRPVHVTWSRADELGWEPLGPAMVVDLSATLDTAGKVTTWACEVWSNGHTSRPGYAGDPGLLAASQRAGAAALKPAVDPPIQRGGGSLRNADPIYAFPARQVIGHRILEMPLRTSALRALGAFVNVFAIESFMDELAQAASHDPLDYRLQHLTDPRARRVLEVAAGCAGWAGWTAPDGVGHGLAVARYKNTGAYCAVVAEVEAVREVRVRRLVLAVDAGRVVNPDGLRNQIEGGAIQATSWALKEQVRFDRYRVTSTDWEHYPILRFTEVPDVEVHTIEQPDLPPVGVGEAAQGPTAAAIGNAVADAVGVHVRTLPLTAQNIVAAIEG